MSEQSPVPEGHPMMQAWERYKASPEYANSFRWAAQEQHRDGSMWAAFVSGWQATDPRDEIVVHVPREPTDEMLDVDVPVRSMAPIEVSELQEGKPLRASRRSLWRAMISVAPQVSESKQLADAEAVCDAYALENQQLSDRAEAAESRVATLTTERDELKRLWQDTETPYDRLQQIKLLIAERDAMKDVVNAAKLMPRFVPGAGVASTVHVFRIEAGIVWALDKALRALTSLQSIK